ncbi:MAG: hypothetical protein ANABAC_2259 [Anaerolineae bacterium]|nr:MAG: hypothetical protein ANABAC_2259 [Anaerolineae bacterium]
MQLSVTHFQPLTTIRRERLLPFAGKVLARKGQKVQATDVVAECELTSQFVLVEYARGLGLSPQQADACVQVKVGMDIEKGDVIAGPVGMMKRLVRAPYAGRVMLMGDGQLLLRLKSQPFSLRAGFEGTVVELIADRGVILQTVGVLAQGIWGNGLVANGIVAAVLGKADEELTENHLDQRAQNAIVIGSYVTTDRTLEKAATLQIRGLVLGGLEATLIPLAEKMPYPILVLDGFGPYPMNPYAFPVLVTNERREAYLSAEKWDALRGTRPEIIIPLPVEDYPAESHPIAELTVGVSVRITRKPYCGRIGKVEKLLSGKAILPNGLSVQAAQVRLADDEVVLSPIANLEIVET